MAINSLATGNVLGFTPQNPSGATGTSTVNAALGSNLNLAFGFIARNTTSINEFRCYCSAIGGTGSFAATDAVATLYTDSAGNPGSAVGGSSNTLSSTTPTAATEMVFSSFSGSTAVTAGSRYWMILSNNNGTKTYTVRYGASNTGEGPLITGSSRYWGDAIDTYNGSTWASVAVATCGWRVGYADGTYYGLDVNNIAATSSASSTGVYGTIEVGTVFTAPSNTPLNLIGLQMYLSSPSGSPSGTLTYVLRQYTLGGTLVNTYTTGSIAATSVLTTGWYPLFFTSRVTIYPGYLYRITMADSAADSSSNYYKSYVYTIANDASSKAQWIYSAKQTVTADNTASPIVWTDTDTAVLPYGLILDPGGEFVSSFIAPPPMIVRGITQY